jgi:hypothetical protein
MQSGYTTEPPPRTHLARHHTRRQLARSQTSLASLFLVLRCGSKLMRSQSWIQSQRRLVGWDSMVLAKVTEYGGQAPHAYLSNKTSFLSMEARPRKLTYRSRGSQWAQTSTTFTPTPICLYKPPSPSRQPLNQCCQPSSLKWLRREASAFESPPRGPDPCATAPDRQVAEVHREYH